MGTEMIGIARLFTRFAELPDLASLMAMPVRTAAGTMVLMLGVPEPIQPIMVNFAAAFWHWWRAPQRVIWRLRPATAARLAAVNLNFVPETPPPAWTGSVFAVESVDQSPLFDDVFALVGYHMADGDGQPRYWLAWMDTAGGAYAGGVRADLGQANERLARSGGLLDLSVLGDDGISGPADQAGQLKFLAGLRFGLAAAYYAESPERTLVTRSDGPLERNAKGKVIKQDGKVMLRWRYADLSMVDAPRQGGTGGELDKDGLALSPVLVSPYIRRHTDGRIVFVDAHTSHRWTRAEDPLGTKRTI